jgi:hypothetical protein
MALQRQIEELKVKAIFAKLLCQIRGDSLYNA